MFTHSLLLLLISLLALFLILLSLLISAVIHGIFSSLMVFTGHTFFPDSIIRVVSFASFFFIISTSSISAIPSSISSPYLRQSPFFIFSSILLTCLLILPSFFQAISTGTWSEERSSRVAHPTSPLPSIAIIPLPSIAFPKQVAGSQPACGLCL